MTFAHCVQVRMLQEQVESLEVDVSDMRADLAHLSAQYHSLKAAKGWYFSCRSPPCLPTVPLLRGPIAGPRLRPDWYYLPHTARQA